jgi:hypothetical protein
MVAEGSKLWTVSARAGLDNVGSNLIQDIDIYCLCCVYVFYVFVYR